jgi:xanthine dehydrogenase accessory factor
MLALIQELETAVRNGKPVCYTALVETRGSTPQKAGATMLVFPNGAQVGTLGGGCVEAEVKRRALELLADGSTELLTFQLDNDYGWDDGLICGGRMKMLVDPLRPGDDASYYRVLFDLLSAGRGITEAIVIDSKRAGGAHDANRWLLDEHGHVVASRLASLRRGTPLPSEEGGVGTMDANPKAPLTLSPDHRSGGAREDEGTEIPPQLLANLRPLVERPRPYIAAGISYLPQLKRCRLVIVGAGHVGQRVADLAADVGFDVTVVDDRQEYCNPERFPQAKRLIVDSFDTALPGLEIDCDTYCIIVTRGHNHDEQALFHLAETSARYVGMIGSRRKIKLIFDDLLREGISREALARVFAPLGFDIGSQTVPEIAVSIVAELIAHRNLGRLPDRIRPTSVLEDEAH